MSPWGRILARIQRRRLGPTSSRLASTAIQSLNQAPVKPGALVLLENVQVLLQRDFAGLDIWHERLQHGVETYSIPRRKRIGIWGSEFSGRSDVAAALAQDVLESSTDVRELLRNRERRTEQSTISIGCEPGDHIVVTSPWLQSLDLHILEVTSEKSSAAFSQLLQCDTILLVVDPYTLTDRIPPGFRYLLSSKSAHLVVNGPLPPDVSEAEVRGIIHQRGISAVSFLQAGNALTAIESFNKPQTSAHTLEVFQRRFSSSGIEKLQRVIAETLPNPQDTALALAEAAMTAMDGTVILDLDSNATTRDRGVKLESIDTVNVPEFSDSVTRCFTDARQELDNGFQSRWTWLNLVLKARIDDCGREAAEVIRRHIGDDLGAQLAFELGKIDQLQREWAQRADQTLQDVIKDERGPSSSTVNALATLARSSNHTETRSLHIPSHQQFMPLVARLHRSAERAALGMWTLGFSSAGASWLASSLNSVSTTPAVAGSVLGLLVSLRIGQQLWHRAQRRFRRDWDRLAVLTTEDLRLRVTTLADATVTARPLAVSHALIDLAQSRERRLRTVQDRVKQLREDLMRLDMHT